MNVWRTVGLMGTSVAERGAAARFPQPLPMSVRGCTLREGLVLPVFPSPYCYLYREEFKQQLQGVGRT